MSEQKPNDHPTFSSFIDWCQNKDSISKEARHMVEALLEYAGTSDCYEADRILSNCTELKISKGLGSSRIRWGTEADSDLCIHQNQISDLSPLSCLTKLTKLYLYYNQISDLSPLSCLTKLTKLYLYQNQISDLSPLSTLTSLTELYLNTNQISDISPLSNLTNLTQLYLNDNQISDISPLSTLTNLTILNLGKNPIIDITVLSCLTNLRELYLHSKQISDLSPLSTLTNLKYLDIRDNQIADISILSSFTGLICLVLNSNQISDLSSLSGLTKLRKLYLDNNQILDLSPLCNLTNLIVLTLDLNPISNLSLPRSLQEKWHLLSQKPIDRQKAKEAIKSAYAIIGKAEPEIIFCNNPYKGQRTLRERESLGEPLAKQLSKLITKLLSPVLWDFLWGRMNEFQPVQELTIQMARQLQNDRFYINYRNNYISSKDLLKLICLSEYFISTLGCVLDPETQEAFHCINQLFEHCGWIFPYGDVCIVCDRPTQLLFDNQYRLHAEGKPAIQFSDGYSLYSYHGVTLPEKYGKLHPNDWQSEWILSEQNSELRRVLIQGIGYARICQELEAEELDNWREYTLLRIKADLDGFDLNEFEEDDDIPEKEPVYLLKMTCPSTGHIHALRVPPDMQSAREAIRWVNWDIDPEEFSVQT